MPKNKNIGPKPKKHFGVKIVDGVPASEGIPMITNRHLGITIYEKCGSSNLIKFFTEDYDREWGLTSTDIHKFQNITLAKSDIRTLKGDFILIVVTRNEYDRWCAGVTQDIDEEADLCDMTIGEVVDEVASALDNTPEYINMFMRAHSHLGQKAWFNDVVSLTNNKNVHYIDIKDLSDRRFWEWVCKMDPEWPDIKSWWGKWINDYSEYDLMHKNRLVTEWIRLLLHNHKELEVIKNILSKNQQVINDIFSKKGLNKYYRDNL